MPPVISINAVLVSSDGGRAMSGALVSSALAEALLALRVVLSLAPLGAITPLVERGDHQLALALLLRRA